MFSLEAWYLERVPWPVVLLLKDIVSFSAISAATNMHKDAFNTQQTIPCFGFNSKFLTNCEQGGE